MKYNIAIVEDSPSSADTLISYIKRYSEENDVEFEIFTFLDGDEIVSDYEAKYDIIFLDIEMKRLDGMSAAMKIRNYDRDAIIIFITNMAQYAIKGYSVDALSFLLKPVPYFAFSEELKKSIERINSYQHRSILLPTENGIVKLNSKDILYIESMGHNLEIVCKDNKYNIKGTLKKIEETLGGSTFIRCNNGYLVNLTYVSGVKDEDAIVGKYRLKISRPRKKEFMEALIQYIGGII